MVSENTVLTKVINRKFKKCGFCNKELKPIGFDYLYVEEGNDIQKLIALEYDKEQLFEENKILREKIITFSNYMTIHRKKQQCYNFCIKTNTYAQGIQSYWPHIEFFS